MTTANNRCAGVGHRSVGHRAIVALAIATAALLSRSVAAQAPRDTTRAPVVFDDRGITFNARDGVSSLALRFRLQEWAVFTTADDELRLARTQFAARRARLRIESVVWDPRLSVNVQLSFARGDQDPELPAVVSVLRDAVVRWRATPRLTLAAGQTKLPSNRQRMTSSGDLQFPDRSIVNAAFTADRDVGVFAHYEARGVALPYNLRLAITSGEGRNPSTGDAGLAYTGRLELLPLGAFTAAGDFFEGDHAREPHGRLSIAAAISRNDGALRTGGQLGKALFQPRGITTAYVDAVYKHAGFAVAGEFARRLANNPVTTNGTDSRSVLAGDGITTQASYMFRSRFEPAIRLSQVSPHRDLAVLADVERQRQFSAGLSRYFKGHKVKSQTEILRDEFRKLKAGTTRSTWTLRTSLEVGI